MRNNFKWQYIVYVNRSIVQAVFISVVLLTGAIACSSTQNGEAQNSSASSNPGIGDLSTDTKGEWVPIQSDNVSMAGYDASTQTMTVMFDNGKSYWYQPVDQSVWTAFYNAQPHPWSQVGYPALVESGVPYGKLN